MQAKLRGQTPKKDDLVEYEIEDDCDCPKGWSEDKFLTIPENLQKIISGGEEVNTGVKVNYPTWWPNHDGQSVEYVRIEQCKRTEDIVWSFCF